MSRILGFSDGIPNFIIAAKLASIAQEFSQTGQATVYPFKRRARRNEGSMYVLAYLLSVDEFELEGSKIDVAEKIFKNLEKKKRRGLRIVLGLYARENEGLIKKYLGRLLEVIEKSKDPSSRAALYDKVFLDAFGGYGTFSLAALNLGLRGVYAEYNPVAHFFFKTFVSGEPKGLEKRKMDFLTRLSSECSRYRKPCNKGKHYATIRARIGKCVNCGSHVPIVIDSYKRRKIPNMVLRKDGAYKVELYEEYGTRRASVRLYTRDKKGLPNGPRRCPRCGREYNDPKPLLKAVKKDEHPIYGKEISEIPRAYGIPIAEACGESLEDPCHECVEEAEEELYENRDEYKELVPYEKIPESVDKSPHGTTEIRPYIDYRTQLMTPRQLVCYAKIVKYLRERDLPEDVRDRLAMLVAKSLQQNVLTRIEHSRRGVKHISANQSYNYVLLPAELEIPGSGEGSIANILSRKYDKISVFTSLPNYRVELRTGFRVKTSGEPGINGVVALRTDIRRLEYESFFDVVFVDPPYVDKIPYRDLSLLYRVRLNKVVPLGDPKEYKSQDLTESDADAFINKLEEAFRRISKAMKPDAVGVLQFSPPKKINYYDPATGELKHTESSFKPFRSRVLAAMLASDLYPIISASVFTETSKTRGVSDIVDVKTVFVLFGREEAAEKFLENLLREYSGEIDYNRYGLGPDEIADYVMHLMRRGRLRTFLERLLDPRSSPIAPKASEIVPLMASIAALIVGQLIESDDRRVYERAIRKVIEGAEGFVTEIMIRNALAVHAPRDFIEEDATFVYAYGLAVEKVDEVEIRRLAGRLADEVLRKLFDVDVESRSMSKFVRRPRPLKSLVRNYRALRSLAPALYNAIAKYNGLSALTYASREAYEALYNALRKYEPDDDEETVVANELMKAVEELMKEEKFLRKITPSGCRPPRRRSPSVARAS